MAVICLWLGRKFFPVPYPLGRMALYIALALLIWLVSGRLTGGMESLTARLALNTGFMLAYALVVFGVERSKGGLLSFSTKGSRPPADD